MVTINQTYDVWEEEQTDWSQYHQRWIAMWNDHHNCIVQGQQYDEHGHLHENSKYTQWYILRTIRYISPHESPPIEEVSIHISDK